MAFSQNALFAGSPGRTLARDLADGRTVSSKQMNTNDSLQVLVGDSINAVAFVMDYVEFHFNGRVLRSLTDPILSVGADRFVFPDAGSRDALCTLIDKKVTKIEARDDIAICLQFGSDTALTIPLDQSSRTGPEAAHFVDPDAHVMDVW